MMDIIGHIRERRDITREELETLLATKEEETVRQLQGRGAVKKNIRKARALSLFLVILQSEP